MEMREVDMMIKRRLTKKIKIGDKFIGGDAPISIQSMPTCHTKNIDETVSQIHQLTEAGCDIVRVAIFDKSDATAIPEIKSQISIPLIADIHYNYKLALDSIRNGADKIRINPGNMLKEAGLGLIIQTAKEYDIPIRIGVNSGSLSKTMIDKYGGVSADGIVDSVLEYCEYFEKFGFENLILALKSSNVLMSVEAYRKISEKVDYPLHVGITESGTQFTGTIKSTLGIGILLAEGIGDTIRVSLSTNPVNEIYVAKEILNGLEIRTQGINIVSCPTCGRCMVDLFPIVEELEPWLRTINKDLTVALMGCSVNGPGEARTADIGIAGGKDCFALFKKGEIVTKLSPEEAIPRLKKEIESM